MRLYIKGVQSFFISSKLHAIVTKKEIFQNHDFYYGNSPFRDQSHDVQLDLEKGFFATILIFARKLHFQFFIELSKEKHFKTNNN